MADRRVYQQIEDAADYYPPANYDHLTFHNAMFEREEDPTSSDYVPLTSALLPNRTQVLPFIIGILPPSAKITGRLLDRTIMVPDKGDSGNPLDKSLPSSALPNPSGGGKPLWPVSIPFRQGKPESWGGKENQVYNDFWWADGGYNPNFIGRDGTPHLGIDISAAAGTPLLAVGTGTVIRVSSASDPNNRNKSGGTTVTIQFEQNGSTYTAYYAHMNDLSVTEGQTVTAGDIVGTIGNTGNAANTQSHCHFELSQDGQRVDPQKNLQPVEVYQGGPVGGDVGSSGAAWAKSGSVDARAAKTAENKLGNKVLTGVALSDSQIGQRLQSAQRNVIRALQDAVDQMSRTPPLKMLINPESFKVGNQKIVSDGNWGRNGAGVGIEHWGDAQDTISASGKVAGFYAQDTTGYGPGLTRMARGFSQSYANFLSLYLIYRNNGGVWIEDYADTRDVQTTKPNNLAMLGSIYIYYDSTLYIGSFDSFEMSEEDTAPFTLSYSFEFTVRATYLLDRVGNENPNASADYGIPQTFNNQTPVPTVSTPPPAPVVTPPVPVNATITDSPSDYRTTTAADTYVIPSGLLIGPSRR